MNFIEVHKHDEKSQQIFALASISSTSSSAVF